MSTLRAQIVERRRLEYADGPCAVSDRPAFVRAASGIAFFQGRIVVLQDDAAFLGLCTRDGRVESVALPRDAAGRRRFEDSLGNKMHKPDYESCVVIACGETSRLVAFGSGSSPVRCSLLVVAPEEEPSLRIHDATTLYTDLAAEAAFAGTGLNIEGAVVQENRLRLFQRGNGQRGHGAATVDLPLLDFTDWLDGCAPRPPRHSDVRHYDLGAAHGVPFGFTDACAISDHRVAFLASAEDTPNAIDDGEVFGSRIGWIEGDMVRSTDLLDECGDVARVKAEGLAIDPDDPSTFWVVLDPDDPQTPSDLCKVRVGGFG